jgi:hypothetical protein
MLASGGISSFAFLIRLSSSVNGRTAVAGMVVGSTSPRWQDSSSASVKTVGGCIGLKISLRASRVSRVSARTYRQSFVNGNRKVHSRCVFSSVRENGTRSSWMVVQEVGDVVNLSLGESTGISAYASFAESTGMNNHIQYHPTVFPCVVFCYILH